ncbi:MAG: molybdenum cofactor guanylyltransferase [Actinomycetota bacterium]
MERIHPAGLLLTGGASRRMRRDKATIEVGGIPLAVRVARALAQVAYPVLAVGNEAETGLPVVDDPREGPLVAFVAGAAELRARGHDGPILLVACDLPLIEAALLEFVAGSLGDADVALPVLDDRDQQLCACYSQRAAVRAAELVAEGARAMRDLLDVVEVRRLGEGQWTKAAPAIVLWDVDDPEDLEAIRRSQTLGETDGRSPDR